MIIKRTLFIIVITTILATSAKSQILIAMVFGDKLNNEKLEFGLNVGANFSTISGIDNKYFRDGLNIGLNFDYKFNNRLFLNPALFFSYPMGGKNIDNYEFADSNLNELLKDGYFERQLSYFSLPVTIRYRLFGKTFIDIGPQVSLRYNAIDDFYIETENGGELTFKNESKEEYTLFDVGVTAGITQKIREKNGVGLKLRYYYGLVNISKNGDEQHNSVFSFSVSIPIGANKEDDNKE